MHYNWEWLLIHNTEQCSSVSFWWLKRYQVTAEVTLYATHSVDDSVHKSCLYTFFKGKTCPESWHSCNARGGLQQCASKHLGDASYPQCLGACRLLCEEALDTCLNTTFSRSLTPKPLHQTEYCNVFAAEQKESVVSAVIWNLSLWC